MWTTAEFLRSSTRGLKVFSLWMFRMGECGGHARVSGKVTHSLPGPKTPHTLSTYLLPGCQQGYAHNHLAQNQPPRNG